MTDKNNYINQNDDNWSTLAVPVSKKDITANNDLSENNSFAEAPKIKKNKSVGFVLSPILTFQLIICLFVLTFAFVAKTFFTKQYESVKSEYDKEIKSSMFFDGKIQDNEYNNIFFLTSDED